MTIESELCPRIAKVLGALLDTDSLTCRDNFFAFGGDSLSGLRAVEQINQEFDAQLPYASIFEAPTAHGLAAALGETLLHDQLGGSQTQALSEAPQSGLLPCQYWYYADVASRGLQYGLAVHVPTQFGSRATLVAAALETVRSLDALRTTYNREGTWGTMRTTDPRLQVRDFEGDATDHEAATEVANLLMQQLSPETGVVLGLGIPSTHASSFVICVHHLAADAFSLGLIVKRIRTMLQSGSSPVPSETMLGWTGKLHRYVRSSASQREQEYWLGLRRVERLAFAREFDGVAPLKVSTRSQPIDSPRLSRAATYFGMTSAECFCAALALAYRQMTGMDALAIGRTLAGRDIPLEGTTIADAVGWFAISVPHILDLPPEATAEAFRSIKEQLRGVPNGGVGNQVWQYAVPDSPVGLAVSAARESADLVVNFYDEEVLGVHGDSAPPTWLRIRTGDSLGGGRTVVRVGVGRDANGQLNAEWTFNPDVHHPRDIESFSRYLAMQLDGLPNI